MKITIVSSCTGRKTLSAANALTLHDFMQGQDYVARREAEIAASTTAAALYSGDHHVRLMRGIAAARSAGATVNLWIVSAGYGLLAEDDVVSPYEATFNDLSMKQSRQWALHLGLHEKVKQVLATPADLSLILLGGRYMDACAMHQVTSASPDTWALVGENWSDKLDASVKPIVLHQRDTTRFKAGMIGLKGAVAASILSEPQGRYDMAVQSVLDRT